MQTHTKRTNQHLFKTYTNKTTVKVLMKSNRLICPVSDKKINNHVSRLTAGMIMSLLVLFLVTQQSVFLIIAFVHNSIIA